MSPNYVPEAHGVIRAVAGLDELKAQTESGFYEMPALVYQGDAQPRAVVYLSRPSQFGRMPASVRNLRLVRQVELSGEVNTATLVVIDRGITLVIPADARAAARRRPRAKAADLVDAWNACGDRNFCVWDGDNWGGFRVTIDGPSNVGTGWHNFPTYWRNWANSMVNRRDGDSLLADGNDGSGARYCAQQQSYDSTFSNNFGNNVANSWALLGSADNRC
ncbi:MAG: peptidase inhibitor family I36 protein [Chloroflexi bacterium]|nr:peptidase inhibitor family I36 protein [Chloroflexota bacterium]